MTDTGGIAGAQRIRLRRTMLAMGGGLGLSAVVLLLHARGELRADALDLVVLQLVFWAVNLSFPALVLCGLNLRLRDPDMTLAQVLWATLATFVALYLADGSRHLVLMVYLVTMMFGTFRLGVGQYLVVATTAVVLYAVALAALGLGDVGEVDPHREFFDWLVFFAVMVGFAVLGGEASRLRDELQRRNRELEEAHDAAALAYEAKSRFLATTSHELRTPLNAILGATDVIDVAALRADERASLESARNAGEHLLSLVNSMIDLSKLESGSLELRTAPMDLASEVGLTHAMLAPIAERRGVGYELDVDPSLPTRVEGDSARLREVLMNLLHNAIKFTWEGRVVLRVSPDDDDGSRVRFAVRDTGQGIAPERLPTLFDPFTPGDESTVRAVGGSGLGLALCHRLVELMGGTLEVASGPGEGSCFSFAIPLPAHAQRDDARPSDAPTRVLIVDDSPDNRLLLKAFLKTTGAEIDEAENGAEGVRHFRERPYDVVLMDMHMPVMDGIEATRAMRSHERDRGSPATVILALTADDSVHDRGRSLAAGCDDHLVKPISKRSLLAALDARLG